MRKSIERIDELPIGPDSNRTLRRSAAIWSSARRSSSQRTRFKLISQLLKFLPELRDFLA
jgi:hypothetical protein